MVRGAIVVSLGHEYAGMFSNNDTLAQHLVEAGQKEGEKVWRMPLHANYEKLIKSSVADMQNIGPRDGGAITAAQFLEKFVNDVNWAHLVHIFSLLPCANFIPRILPVQHGRRRQRMPIQLVPQGSVSDY